RQAGVKKSALWLPLIAIGVVRGQFVGLEMENVELGVMNGWSVEGLWRLVLYGGTNCARGTTHC
ncbi:hypothetical protein, partial [Cecembia lonarensis]|uniref:hypothetical protein n=1 Tax=Cecembia lonarensis TaxID=645110 RepID=UPI00058B5759